MSDDDLDPTADVPVQSDSNDVEATSSRRVWRERRGAKKQRGLAFKIATRTAAALAGLAVIGIIVLFVIYQRTEIPAANADAQKQISILYYDDGKTELARFNNTTREDVSITQVPKHVQHAFLAAEDRNFYDNSGVSVTGMGRALWANVTGGRMQGGSTITQQYVKNYFLSQDRTMSRKVNEVMIAIKIERKLPKEKILQNYLNTIYFGRNAYGIQAASKAYFDKDAKDLTVSEGAFLASIINSPGRMDPANGSAARNRANARMVYVLDGMVDEGWLSKGQRAAQRMPHFEKRKRQTIPGPNGYLRDLVEKEIKGPRGMTQQDIDRGGLRITTTINRKAQRAAVKAVEDKLPDSGDTKDLHVGLTAQRPKDGAVVAVYGGRDPAKEANNATYQHMQSASGFKVFGLLNALDQGMTLQTQYNGRSPMKFPGYGARGATNYGNISYGNVTLRKATANSINTVFLQLNQDVGPASTRKMAERVGIPASSLDKPTLANILGTDSVRVLDMTTGYNTIAGEGEKATPYYIKKMTSVRGDYSYTAKPKKTRVVDRAVAMNTREAMEDVVKYGSAAQGTRGLGRPAAGKTGTASGNKAVWFNGFTPQLTASVGIFKSSDGGKTSEEMTNIAGIPNLTGGTFPTEIWTSFMKAALKGEKVEEFPDAPRLKQTFSPTTKRTTDRSRSSTSEDSTSSSSSSSSSSTSTSSSSSSSSTSTSSSSSSSSSSSTSSSSSSSSSTPPPSTSSSTPPPSTSSPPPPSTSSSVPRPTWTPPRPPRPDPPRPDPPDAETPRVPEGVRPGE